MNYSSKKNKILNIYNILLQHYGPQGWWPQNGKYFPDNENKYEVILGAILTQNTSWKNVERALNNLRKKELINPDRILSISIDKLAELIKPSGYYNQKAKRIMEVTKALLPFLKKGKIPTREELLNIKGIGPETADSILLYAFHVPVFVIDAYTIRFLERLNLCHKPCNYYEAQQLFMNNLPMDEKVYNEYHALLVKHCKDICKKNPECEICPIKNHGLCNFPS